MKVRVLMSADVTLQIETIPEGFVEVRIIEEGGDNVAMLLSPIDALRVAEALKLGAVELAVPARAVRSVATGRMTALDSKSLKWQVYARLREEALFLTSPGQWVNARRMLVEGKTRADLLRAGVCIEGPQVCRPATLDELGADREWMEREGWLRPTGLETGKIPAGGSS